MSNRLYKVKKNIRRKSQILIGIPEPQRESLYDILCDNLDRARRNIYLNRLIYLGEHSFDNDSEESISDVFREIVREVNSGYNDEPITGIFLHYKKFFVHMVEGSEDSILKHFQILLDEEVYKKISRMKLLLVINHINQRFVKEWLDIPGRPATLLEKIDPDCDLEKSSRYFFNCVQKVYQLCKEIHDIKIKQEEDDDSIDLKHRTQEKALSNDSSLYEEVLKPYYPEINLLQFLVQSRFLKDMGEDVKMYGCPIVPDSYKDEVWPIPSTMIPYTIFEKPKDPCVDLPTHKVEQVEEIVIDDETQMELSEQQ